MRIGVVSLGLIGGSIARRLSDHGHEVTAWNPSPEVLEYASAFGIASAPSVAQLCALEPDVLILANPLRAMPAVIEQVAAAVRPATVVTDVGSVKEPIAQLVRDAGLSGQFVGAHPMAGKELTGFAAADPQLLDGAHWALAVEHDTDAADFLRVARMVTEPLGGVVHAVDPGVHDEAVALISHVPHVLATQLLNMVTRTPVRDLAVQLAAGSFRDGTRVAHTDPRRTEAMVVENSAWVAPALRVVIRDLERVAEQLESNAPVASFFDQADPLRERRLSIAAASQTPATQDPRTLDLALENWRTLVQQASLDGATITAVDEAAGTVTLLG